MNSHDTIHAQFAQSLVFQLAKVEADKKYHNASRARVCLLLSERHWKKVVLYSSQLNKYDDNWRNPQAMTKQELDLKITNHQRRAIELWEKYNHFKNQ